jgi:hypothetical protein
VDKQNAMYETAYPRWTANMLMKNSDQGKYGTLMTGLMTQFSMGVNMYPESVVKAIDILTNHKIDSKSLRTTRIIIRGRRIGMTMIQHQQSLH